MSFGVNAVSFTTNADTKEIAYAIISESNQTPLSINAEKINIDGLAYSNCGIQSNVEIENQKDNFSLNYSVTNFSPQLMAFDENVETCEDDFFYYGYKKTLNTFGLSSVTTSSYNLEIDEILGANNDVVINSYMVESASEDEESIIFSSNGNISINTNTFDFDGVIYAPYGSVKINALDVDVCGLIIAQEVQINSERLTVSSNSEIFEKYDIGFYVLGETPIDIDIMAAAGSSSSGNSSWYYNTGTNVQTKAKYSKYKLLTTVKKGDIIHENRSWSVGAITGHVACVEGIYYLPAGSYTKLVPNIRVIEAISSGVCRSVLDDTRVDDNKVVLLRYKNTISSSNINKVLAFMIGQLGKPYKMDMSRNTSFNTSNCYCSELVWAAYNSIGLDIEAGDFGAITPGDIKDSNNTKTISFK